MIDAQASGRSLPPAQEAAADKSKFSFSAPLLPKADMRGFALISVIAIMSFLAAWAVFAAHFIGRSAAAWQALLARQAVVQIMPAPGRNMEKDLAEAANIARSFGGVAEAHIVSPAETQALLAPWLGEKADIAALPVPRLVLLKLDTSHAPDFDGLREALRQNIAGARFDRRQIWADKLAQGAHIMLSAALVALALVLIALVLTIIFATNGAVAAALPIIEVLHFIGADDRFIARRFDSRFFRAGLKGALLGIAAACGLFAALFLRQAGQQTSLEAGQMAALFGRLNPDWRLAGEIAALILAVACLTMAACHITLIRRLRHLDAKSSNFFSASG